MTFKRITNEEELQDALQSDVAVLYKHSTGCGMSAAAIAEVYSFSETHPDTPVYLVDVLADRPVSNRVAETFGIRHHSPQVIIIHGGEAVFNTSHMGVTEDALVSKLPSRN